MVARPSLAVAGALCLALCDASTARAYCRTHTGDGAEQRCPSACQNEGFPLGWRTPDVEYVFNERGFPMVTDAALRAVFERSFATWERVRCGDDLVGITSHAASGTTSALSGHTASPSPGMPNENVIMHFSPSDWLNRDLAAQAFAVTAVWYNPRDGEIFGADMMFNGRMDPFGVCPDDATECRRSVDVQTDLQNVVTHEIGHLLGLSHSDVEASTMWCDADAKEISKRDLAADDIEGVCAIYPPGRDGGSGAGADDDADEGCRLSGRATPWELAPLLVGVLALRLRRRRRGG